MTGYGKFSVNSEGKKFIVDVKSLNSKSLNASIKLPPQFKEIESQVRNIVSAKLIRGNIELNLALEQEENKLTNLINRKIVGNFYTEICDISKQLGIEPDQNLILKTVLGMPGVLKNEENEFNELEKLQVLECVGNAVEELNKFRIKEGEILKNDICDKVLKIKSLQSEISKYKNERIILVKEKLKAKIEENIPSEIRDDNRFEQEIIYYLEKFDINEEEIRLANHCNYFQETITEEESGRKLGFIAQEMGREINTLGSKANHSEIQKLVIMMKDELEKVKEQLLNVL